MTTPRGPSTGAAAPPYAAPYAAVDDVLVVERPDGGLELRATKDISAVDRYQAAHFPDRTVHPGVFILETVRQAVLTALGERAGELPELAEVRSIRFHSALRPGERLTASVDVAAADPAGTIAARARCHRADGSEVATMTLAFRYGVDGDA